MTLQFHKTFQIPDGRAALTIAKLVCPTDPGKDYNPDNQILLWQAVRPQKNKCRLPADLDQFRIQSDALNSVLRRQP